MLQYFTVRGKHYGTQRKAVKTPEDLEDDMKKGQQKVKALIRRCLEDFDENKL